VLFWCVFVKFVARQTLRAVVYFFLSLYYDDYYYYATALKNHITGSCPSVCLSRIGFWLKKLRGIEKLVRVFVFVRVGVTVVPFSARKVKRHGSGSGFSAPRNWGTKREFSAPKWLWW